MENNERSIERMTDCAVIFDDQLETEKSRTEKERKEIEKERKKFEKELAVAIKNEIGDMADEAIELGMIPDKVIIHGEVSDNDIYIPFMRSQNLFIWEDDDNVTFISRNSGEGNKRFTIQEILILQYEQHFLSHKYCTLSKEYESKYDSWRASFSSLEELWEAEDEVFPPHRETNFPSHKENSQSPEILLSYEAFCIAIDSSHFALQEKSFAIYAERLATLKKFFASKGEFLEEVPPFPMKEFCAYATERMIDFQKMIDKLFCGQPIDKVIAVEEIPDLITQAILFDLYTKAKAFGF